MIHLFRFKDKFYVYLGFRRKFSLTLMNLLIFFANSDSVARTHYFFSSPQGLRSDRVGLAGDEGITFLALKMGPFLCKP